MIKIYTDVAMHESAMISSSVMVHENMVASKLETVAQVLFDIYSFMRSSW